MTEILYAHFKPEGTHPEIKGPFYELSSYFKIHASYNARIGQLDYVKDDEITSRSGNLIEPRDPTKPVVLAVATAIGTSFVLIDHNGEDDTKTTTRSNEKIEVDDSGLNPDPVLNSQAQDRFWSITNEGITFVFGEVSLGTWSVPECDLLCAFVGGEMTVVQLFSNATWVPFPTDKENKQARIKMQGRIQTIKYQLEEHRRSKMRAERVLDEYEEIVTGIVKELSQTVDSLLKLIK